MDIFWTTILAQNKSITRCLLFYNQTEHTWLNNWVSARKIQKEKKSTRVCWIVNGATPNESWFLSENILCQAIITGVCYWFCVSVCVRIFQSAHFFIFLGSTHNLDDVTALVKTLWFLHWKGEKKSYLLFIECNGIFIEHTTSFSMTNTFMFC